jgi:hypothetical protein
MGSKPKLLAPIVSNRKIHEYIKNLKTMISDGLYINEAYLSTKNRE